MSNKVCVLPFTHLHLRSNGQAQVCCAFQGAVWRKGRPFSVYQDPLESIWNSDHLVGIRRDMAEGREVAGCEYCNSIERIGGHSKRMSENVEWQDKVGHQKLLSIESLVKRSTANGHRMEGPASYQLDIGNLCNLKCRMCNGLSSSRIQRDRVQQQWADGWAEPLGVVSNTRFSGNAHWFQQKEFVLGELLREPGRLKNLYILGGEPFLIREVGEVLQVLVDSGAARDITLCFNTNGTIARPRWLELSKQFKQLLLWFSVDGHHKHYEYIRYPARWNKLVETLESLRQLPNARASVSVTVQAYNVLRLVDLFRYLDGIGMAFGAASLVYPAYLRSIVLPQQARRVAAERLREYAASGASAAGAATAAGLAHELEIANDDLHQTHMGDFMRFTNDLDVSRGQSLAALDPELMELIRESGFAWTSETRYV